MSASGAFAPYGLGSRTCLSAGMGEALITLVMATLLHTVDLALLSPDYQLKTQIAPIPCPAQEFHRQGDWPARTDRRLGG